MGLLSFFSFLISVILGGIITSKLSLKIHSTLSWSIVLGIIIFTGVNYFTSLIFSFPLGIILGQLIILIFEILYIIYFKLYKLVNFSFVASYLKNFLKDRYLLFLLIVLGIILSALFYTHVLPTSPNGDLLTGESTYGDLPFHLTNISQLAFGNHFPLENPFFSGIPLIYPFLINFFSAILVKEGLTLKDSIIIPGIILSLCLICLVYEFAFSITKKKLSSFLTTIFFFFNGGVGFYFFLKDYSFNLSFITQALLKPTSFKEYSHFFSENIQWVNFTSRMIVPERSLLFGIPAGIIILRILYFRDTEKEISWFDIVISAFLISLMPLLHTHTFLTLAVILPPLLIFNLFKNKNSIHKYLKKYLLLAGLTIYFLIPHFPLFLNHIGSSQGFLRLHLGWMMQPGENFFWFWFKNTYLYVPISLLVLFLPQIRNTQIKFLQILAFGLFIIVNLILFSPFDWDNVKFFFWIGLFFAIAAGTLFNYLFEKRNILIKTLTTLICFSMISTSLLSIYREIFVSHTLFSQEAVLVSEAVKKTSPPQSIFLTYRVHNSPVSNLAGRSILMGYQGSLWVHGINYQDREKDINQIYSGAPNADNLIRKYRIDYVVLEASDPNDLIINRQYFQKFPTIIKSNNYLIYQTK